ncbi:hypothetical protein COCCADRAFT_76826, partial [Bipolaris zeicola 26-R-13]
QTSIPHVFLTSHTKPTRMTIVRKALHILLRLAPATNEYFHPDEHSKPGKHLVLLDHKIDSTVRIFRYMNEHMAGSSLF